MQTIWMIELAALWANHGRSAEFSRLRLPLAALNTYWVASRQRADRWHEALFVYRGQLESLGSGSRSEVWRQLRKVIEEILLSEVLTRVISAIAQQLELSKADTDSSPIASSVFQTHLEARRRCLQLMVDGYGQPVNDAVHLNRLRFQLEEWTDMFLAQLGDCPGAKEHCHRISRLADWTEDQAFAPNPQAQGIDMQLRILGIRRWLSKLSDSAEANPSYNQSICRAALAMLRPEWFDSLGHLQSLTSQRMQAVIEETDGMVSSLISPMTLPLNILQKQESLQRFRKVHSRNSIHKHDSHRSTDDPTNTDC